MEYTFWLQKYHGNRYCETLELPDNISEEKIESELEGWCGNICPQFYTSDMRVDYGYCIVS